ncbi:MAG: glycosyltransferase family 2 protein [Deltaproteobacteria bacterium]|nr:glycosyltransferase family 2 protein [Deltaproteobacteria bacterium]
MRTGPIDILMVTYDRPGHTRLSLPRLLDTCDESMRVWLWHNGTHEETLEIVRSNASHPRVHEFRHSVENVRLREPTNWFWSRATGDYLAKVDDDNLMPDGWGQTLRAAHEAEPRLGVIGCWSFRPEDHLPELAARKVRPLGGGHRLLQNCWVAGTGHLLKRRCIDEQGALADGQTFTNWCVQLAARGWIHGWYYPFLYMENMSDPRSEYTDVRTEEDFQSRRGLSAQRFGVKTLEQSRRRQPLHARRLQTCSTDPRDYLGWRGRARRWLRRLRPGESL